jgi:F-type H+-transporting ATPase subunit alpha
MVIYAVTNGLLDTVPVAEVRNWERGFLEYVSAQFPQVPERIRTDRAISKETEGDLKRAIDGYRQMAGGSSTTTVRASAAAPAAAAR